MSKQFIAMFLPNYEPIRMGGAEIQAKRLAQRLINNNINVIFITPGKKGLPKFETIETIPIYRFRTMTQMINDCRKSNDISKNKNTKIEVKFDYSEFKGTDLLYSKHKVGLKQAIVFVDLLLSAFFSFYKERKKYNIIQINTISYFSVVGAIIGRILRKRIILKDSTMDGILQMHLTPFPNFARKFISKNCYFIAMTETIKNNLVVSGIPLKKINNIPNGIEIDFNINIKKKFKNKCLFVGNLYQQPAKGIDILLKSWCEVITEFADASLTIIGSGNIEAYNEYIKKINIDKSVRFIGAVQPREYYMTHDVFILPSRREGMSNALLEAMMYGMAIVATKISGNIDLIEDNINGFCVKPNNVSSLTQGIKDLLSNKDLMQVSGMNNMHKVREFYNMKEISQKYIKFYDKIDSNHG